MSCKKQFRYIPCIGLLLIHVFFMLTAGCSKDAANPVNNDESGGGGTVLESKTAIVGAGGGSILLSDGSGVAFPAGSLPSSAKITVKSIAPESYFDGSNASRVVISCEGAPKTMNAPAEVRVRLPEGFTVADSGYVFGGLIDETNASVEAEAVAICIMNGSPYAVIEVTHFSKRVIEWIFGKQTPGSAGPLEIPYYGQGSSPYCWAACIQMLTESAKHNEDAEIADIIGSVGVDEGGITDWDFRFNTVIADLIKNRTGHIPARYQWDFINRRLAFDYIRKEIGINGRPVAIHDPIWNHAVVIVGYNGSTVYIHNPNNTNNSAIGYASRSWSEFYDKPGIRDKLVTVVVPSALDTARPMVTANITSGAYEFIKPKLNAADKPAIYRHQWDCQNKKGYTFTEAGSGDAFETLPGTVTTLRQGGDIEIVNTSRTAQKTVSVWIDIYGYGPAITHYSETRRLVVGANGSGRIKFDDIAVDEFRDNDVKPVEYELKITAYDDEARSDVSAIRFKIDSVTPQITALSPDKGAAGDIVTVTGSGFGVSRGNSRVSFADVHVTDIVSWSDTEIKATVPVGAKTGPVVVTRGAVASTGKPFTLTAMKSLRGECSCTYSILDSPLHITTSAVWSVAGEGLVITVSDSTGVCILADARTSGKITIAPDASLIGDTTYETMYGGRRYVYRYKSPQLQPPIKGENYSHSDGITVTPGGGGSELTFEYALHPTHYAGDISIKVWYRVPYDVEVYEKNGDLVSSETDKLGQLYNACYVFIQANDD